MKFTQYTDYSLRVLMHVAASTAGSCTVGEVAAAYDIPESHLTKVVHALGKHGYLATQRGRRGGFTLARPPGDISIGAVVRATERELALVECLARDAKMTCRFEKAGCGLKRVLGRAQQSFLNELDRYTLADVLA